MENVEKVPPRAGWAVSDKMQKTVTVLPSAGHTRSTVRSSRWFGEVPRARRGRRRGPGRLWSRSRRPSDLGAPRPGVWPRCSRTGDDHPIWSVAAIVNKQLGHPGARLLVILPLCSGASGIPPLTGSKTVSHTREGLRYFHDLKCSPLDVADNPARARMCIAVPVV